MDKELSNEEIEKKLKEFQDWINEQPDVPKNFEKLLLLRYLKIARWRVEKAQRILLSTLKLRTENPHIFTNRDPLAPEMQKVLDALDMVPLSTTTPENYKICVYRMIAANAADDIDFNDMVKAFFVVSDVRLITPDENELLCDGEISIYDMQYTSYRHLTKVVVSTVRMYLKYIQEAHPVRVRQMHIINCNPVIDKITALIKPFIRADHFNLIHFHTPGSETLFDYVDKNVLPEEIGGTAGPIAETKMKFMEEIIKNREYLINDEAFKMIEIEKEEVTKSSGGVLDFLF